MKKLLITTAATLLTVAAFAQGTVYFSNSGAAKISTGVTGSASGTWVTVPTTAINAFDYGLMYGIGGSTSMTFISGTYGVNSTSTAGLIASASDSKTGITFVGVPGTNPSDTDVYIQVIGWSASFGSAGWQEAQAASLITPGAYFGESAIVNVAALGASTGPGVPIWQTATGTNPSEIKGGFAMFTAGGVVPEPSTMALTGLGMAALLIFRRRK